MCIRDSVRSMQEVQQEQAAMQEQEMQMQAAQMQVDAMKAPINDPSKNPELAQQPPNE